MNHLLCRFQLDESNSFESITANTFYLHNGNILETELVEKNPIKLLIVKMHGESLVEMGRDLLVEAKDKRRYLFFNLVKGEPYRMEFEFGDFSIVLPPLHITIIAIIIIFLLIRWSKQLETRRFRIFFYFLISTYIAPILTLSAQDGPFQIWIPLGFIIMVFYLFYTKRNHPSKMKAIILGFCIALYQLIFLYFG